MKRHVYDSKSDELLRVEEAEPVCGQDFCDVCGDCLHCNGEDECLFRRSGNEHLWIRYEGGE